MYPQVTFSLFTHSSPACALKEKECRVFAKQSEYEDQRINTWANKECTKTRMQGLFEDRV